MENKTKDSQIHATGGPVKKLQRTPTQCRPHTRTHNNAHFQKAPHNEVQLHAQTNARTWLKHTNQHTYKGKHNSPELSFENLR